MSDDEVVREYVQQLWNAINRLQCQVNNLETEVKKARELQERVAEVYHQDFY